MTTMHKEWERVWHSVKELTDVYPDDIVVIGGVAVYLHARQRGLPAEFTHDADMAIARVALADLRDEYEVVANRRLAKHQITTADDVEIDLYVERNNRLRVDYPELALAAADIDGIRVANLEHLLLLKLDALRDRWRSAHGDKDRRDVAKILFMLESTKPNLVVAHGTAEDLELIGRVLRSDVFLQITDGNAHLAAKLRDRASVFPLTLVGPPS